jgi:ATPase subunit of ABC transporter with duplicated ATPase domains
MIIIKDLSKKYESIVLSGVSLTVGHAQKVALVGPNGVGKSTLIKIIANVESCDSGIVTIPKDACIGYLSQETEIDTDDTIEQYIKKNVGILELEKRMAELESNLQDADSLKEYSDIQQRYIRFDGYAFEHRMKVILEGFGFNGSEIDKPLNNLSGGQKQKVFLSVILLKGVDVLLLDEPTNNLDLPALIWLEQFIVESKATVIIVSHDKKFLDRVVNKVFEIDWFSRNINVFSGRYSDYLIEKNRKIKREKDKYDCQQEEIKKIESTIIQKKSWASKGRNQCRSDNDKFSRGVRRDRAAKSSKAAKAIEQRLIQMEKVERPKEKPSLTIPLNLSEKYTKYNIELKDVVAIVGKFRLGPISIDIPFGSRIGILGINGSGKSTLLKTIIGQIIPKEGKVLLNNSLVIGNLMQEHENLPNDSTLFEFLRNKEGIDDQTAYHLLSKFGFTDNEFNKKVQDLSPGGKTRLILSGFSAISASILILDEPTNHLDTEATEALVDSLSNYQGTILLVSHDRSFMEQIHLTDVFVIKDGLLKSTDYDSYVESLHKEVQRLRRLL